MLRVKRTAVGRLFHYLPPRRVFNGTAFQKRDRRRTAGQPAAIARELRRGRGPGRRVPHLFVDVRGRGRFTVVGTAKSSRDAAGLMGATASAAGSRPSGRYGRSTGPTGGTAAKRNRRRVRHEPIVIRFRRRDVREATRLVCCDRVWLGTNASIVFVRIPENGLVLLIHANATRYYVLRPPSLSLRR